MAEMGTLEIFARAVSTQILPISASEIARITGFRNHAWQNLSFKQI
jgi:hypothetical protein